MRERHLRGRLDSCGSFVAVALAHDLTLGGTVRRSKTGNHRRRPWGSPHHAFIETVDPSTLPRALEVYELGRLDFAEAYLVAQAEATGVGEIASFRHHRHAREP